MDSKDLKYFNKFYLDKEKDIVVELFWTNNEYELCYIIRTPNHTSGNLIKNLAKISGLKPCKDENDLWIISEVIPASINGENEIVYIFRLGGMKIANIYMNRIEVKAKMPAITKTLMSQTKEYGFDIKHTIVKSYLFKKSRFETDLHTHMNAILSPDVLVAFGIANQIKYPLYYIKKLNLKLTLSQESLIMRQRKEVEKNFAHSLLTGKYLIRKIDDNTFINFADLILNNPLNALENIIKIRNSLCLLKDGQSVFTNLEKIYLYRYIFCKGIRSEKRIKITDKMVNQIPEADVLNYTKRMLDDKKDGSIYQNNSIKQDKLLWIAREYQNQGVKYVEITDTDLVKKGETSIKTLEDIHEIMPKIEKETGVKIRFLAGIRRIPLTIIRDQITSSNYLRENLDILKAIAKSPYVVGSDFIGEENNEITELKPVINELVKYVKKDEGFTIRIHAGENEGLRDNVKKSIDCLKEAVSDGQKFPNFRIGHGIYTPDLNTKEGKSLMEEMKSVGAILEFQFTSNIRLNNLTEITRHPIKTYLKNGVNCLQGTDGCGIYGTDTWDEQLAYHNLLGLDDNDFAMMKKVEDKILKDRESYFIEKTKRFKKFLNGKSIREAIQFEIEKNFIESEKNPIQMRISDKIESADELKYKIVNFPENKFPIVIAGGSFNSYNRKTKITASGEKAIKELIEKLDDSKVYFVVGHTLSGYEEAIIKYSKELGKKFEINAIIPKEISKEEAKKLEKIDGIRISTESQGMGLYKSFNYEIFERRNSIVVAFDGNSPVSNLVQEAKNGKGIANIYVNSDVESLNDKANSLQGYVKSFKLEGNLVDEILQDYPELKK